MGFNYIKKSVILLVLLQLFACNKTNWEENFKEKEKSPFGTYIIYNEIQYLFENKKVITLKENVYDFFIDSLDANKNRSTYICIKNSAIKLTENGVNSLLEHVKEGNTIFLSLNYFSDSLKENLEFTTNNLDKSAFTVQDLRKLRGEYYLENSAFRNQPFHFDRNSRRHYFLQYNENNTIVLGTTVIDGEKVPNFIKIYRGKGAIYLHCNPVVFTNYNLLKDKEAYAENVLSYLPSETILWDTQIKTSKYASENKDRKESIFKFFLQHQSLSWFLFVTLFGSLLFMLFNARRKQRPIPMIKPLVNSTVAFTQTIANLYLKEEDHKNIAQKKITYFLEKVRSKYLIDTSKLNKSFIEKLAAKSGNELQKTKYLIHTIITLDKKLDCSEEELMVLHKMIENFFKK
ncbi:DUF4350 domain-containing protein [Polaribacter sp.]|uniref:DUF4350 domain-containing protein n=1 Tax=Polaribacter sp. TaxID=1920175 RepID=UPI003EF2A25F